MDENIKYLLFKFQEYRKAINYLIKIEKLN